MGDSRNTSASLTCTCHDDGEVLDARDCAIHDVCDGCAGTGYESWDRHVVCPDCNGVGR